jgi:hypothetical protein
VSVLGAIAVKLGEVVVKSACEAATGNKLAGDMSGAVSAVLGQQGMDGLAQRKARRQLEERADKLAGKVLELYGHEFRGLTENERAVVVQAVKETFENAPPGSGLVLDADFAPPAVERAVRAATVGFRRSWAFGADESELYDLLLREACADLVEIVRALPSLASVAAPEILARLTMIEAQVRVAPRRALADADAERDARFTEIYRGHVTRALDDVDLTSRRLSAASRRYPLERAYLSLPALIHGAVPASVARIEQVIADRPRVVLLAQCGGGKTTYLSRFFTLVARRSLAAPAELREAMPFYIPLHQCARTELPAPEKFLDHVAQAVRGEMPAGWVQRRLREERTIVLLNGLDEVPAADRQAVLDWVTDLVKQFPRPRYILASRPAAIPKDWPASAGFDVVDLLPMSPADVRTFVERWHDAVGSKITDADARAEVERCAAAVLESLRDSHALRMLSRNPLMCALMCALHRDGRVQLPSQWLDLLKFVVDILVGERDAAREVTDELPVEQRMRVLQNIAFWMITEDLDGVKLDEVLARVEHIVGGLSPDAAGADAMLEHLTVRSGLMYADHEGELRFTSPVVRDYLAAHEALAGGYIRFLIREAHRIARHPVIVMAAGLAHVTRAEELLTGLLKRADAEPAERDGLIVLARACLEVAPLLAEDLQDRVRHQSASLLCPRTEQEGAALAVAASPGVLDVVAVGNEPDLEVVAAVIRTAVDLGDDSVLPFLGRFSRDPRPAVRELLFRAWPAFDPVQYAAVVLQDCPPSDDIVTVDAAVLAAVPLVSWLQKVRIYGTNGTADLAALAGARHMTVYLPPSTGVWGDELMGEGSRVVMGGETP